MVGSLFGKMGDHADSSIRPKLMSHLEVRQLFIQFFEYGGLETAPKRVLFWRLTAETATTIPLSADTAFVIESVVEPDGIEPTTSNVI